MEVMKTLFVTLLLFSQVSWGSEKFVRFMKSCGYGALAGVGAGVLTLALENKPSQHYGNVARGASLGLYGGIIYGLYAEAKPPEKPMYQNIDLDVQTVIVPKFDQARLDGVEVNSTVLSF